MCDHERILAVASQHLSERGYIPDTIRELMADESILKIQMAEFDSVIQSLNDFLKSENLDPRLKNIAGLRSKLKESATFPTLRSLKEEKQFGAYFAVHSAALEFNLLMKAGEEGSKYHGKSIEFHTGISDPSALTTACLIEGYGQFAQKLEGVKGVTREEFVTAFEEALGFVHRDTHLFRNVRDWYTEEEGFSKEFLDFVHTAEPS